MGSSDQKVILLVEDDPVVAVFAKEIIYQLGYEVIAANSGEMAIELVLNYEKINLILLDLDLGRGIDGLTTAWEILKKKSVPIIFLSENCRNEYEKKLMEIPCYGVLNKASGEFALRCSIEVALTLFEKNENLQKEI